MPEFVSNAIWAMVGVSATVIVFLLQKKKTLLQYYISTTPLITEKMAGILNDRMLIDGQPVKSMSSTTISFINSGNQRIKSSDFSEQEPLRIILKGHLYGHDVSLGNQKLLPKVVPVHDNVLNISFENLKPSQFFRVTILHDKTLDVSGELTTGNMREYSHSMISSTFSTILMFVVLPLAIFIDPVRALIGDFIAMSLLGILTFVLTLFLVADMYKGRRERKLFMR